MPGEGLSVEGYDFISKSRESGLGRGGVGILVKEEYTVEQVGIGEQLNKGGLESVWVKVGGKNYGETIVGVVYIRPHCGGNSSFPKDRILDFVLRQQELGYKVVLMGDFNAHFGEREAALDPRARLVSSLCTEGKLTNMNFQRSCRGKWTWYSGQKKSVLDYILLCERGVEEVGQLNIDDEEWFDIGSDHNLLFWDNVVLGRSKLLENTKDKGKGSKNWKWKVKGKVDWEEYRKQISEKMFTFASEMVEEELSAKERYTRFARYFNLAAEESLKKVYQGSSKPSKRLNSWWDKEVKEAIKQRKEACRKHRRYAKLNERFPEIIRAEDVEERWKSYQRQKERAKETIKKKRGEDRERALAQFRKEGKYNSAFFWGRAKQAKQLKLERVRGDDGVVFTGEREVAEQARKHWKKAAESLSSRKEKVAFKSDEVRKVTVDVANGMQAPFTYEEIVKAIKGMKRGKGVGKDKISLDMIVEGKEVLWHNLHGILNCCWEEEFIPEDWLEGIIVALHKGGDREDLGNYRDITLGSHIGKIFTSVLTGRLTQALETGVLGEAQGGFRKNRRTVDQVFVVNGIAQWRRSKGLKTWMAFLDFRKAFPSVWRKGLWAKMEGYGLGGRFLNVCRKLYTDVGARVRVGQTLSDRFEICEGLRQGCTLSPSLFSLFLMDLATELESKGLGVKVRGMWMGACFFADDIVLLAESGHELQRMLNVAYSFAERWQLKFNAKKCGVLVVGQKRQAKAWYLGKERIAEVDEYKYLGVWINRRANGQNHVKHLIEKSAGLHSLARGAKFWRGDEDVEAGLAVWEVACKPVLNYGAEVWACSSEGEERKIEQIQDRGGRHILGVSWRFPGTVVRGELGWGKLRYNRHKLALQYVGRLREMDDCRWPKTIARALASEETKGRGTWWDYVEDLIVLYKLGDMWEGRGWDSREWKRNVSKLVEEEAGNAWKREVEKRGDLGGYGERQKVLGRADYLKGGCGNRIREEIKRKCEWGDHF